MCMCGAGTRSGKTINKRCLFSRHYGAFDDNAYSHSNASPSNTRRASLFKSTEWHGSDSLPDCSCTSRMQTGLATCRDLIYSCIAVPVVPDMSLDLQLLFCPCQGPGRSRVHAQTCRRHQYIPAFTSFQTGAPLVGLNPWPGRRAQLGPLSMRPNRSCVQVVSGGVLSSTSIRRITVTGEFIYSAHH